MIKPVKIDIRNRRASFDYEILMRYDAGIQLYGTEIKSIRASKASLADTYCIFIKHELWVKNMHIASYEFGSYNNHDVRRDRKLLLTRRELQKLERATKETGNTIIPLRLYLNEKGMAKVTIALAKGRKRYDKRQALKQKADRREMERAKKNK